MNLKEMNEAHAAKVAEVVALQEKAKTEELSDEDYDAAKKCYEEAKELQVKIAKAEERKSYADKFASLKGPVETEPETYQDSGAKSLGEQFVSSENFKSARNARGRFSSGLVELKATLTSGTDSTDANAFVTTPTVLPGITELRFQRLTVADLLAKGQSAGPNIRYIVETTFTNAADIVAEGGAKQASTLGYDIVDETTKKIAHTIKVTDETLQDIPQMRSYVDNRMVLGVQITEEDQLLNGTGGSGISGLLDRDILDQPIASDTVADAIYKAMTQIRTTSTFSTPDGIVVNPADWQDLRLAKDDNLQYMAGGPFTGAYGNGGYTNVDAIWGQRVVITNAIAAGTLLVGAFGTEAMLFRRGGLTVEATNSNEDDFLNNLVAVRAEERIALAVFRPQAFCTVSLGS